MQSSRARPHHSGRFPAVSEEGITRSPSVLFLWGLRGELSACILPRAVSDNPSKPRGCLPWSPGTLVPISTPSPSLLHPATQAVITSTDERTFSPVFINEVDV